MLLEVLIKSGRPHLPPGIFNVLGSRVNYCTPSDQSINLIGLRANYCFPSKIAFNFVSLRVNYAIR